MYELVQWLKNMEQLAGSAYQKCAEHFTHDSIINSFLLDLVEDENDHFKLLENVEQSLLSTEKDYKTAIVIDDSTAGPIEEPLHRIINNVKTREITLENTLECIVETETSEWNDIFLYVVDTFKKDIRELQQYASTIQSHEKKLETFLEKFPEHLKLYSKLKNLPGIWTQNFLIVDDLESVRKLIKLILGKIGNVDEASDGQEAIEKVKNNFYDVIVSDIYMPFLNGIEFYLKAIAIDPEIGSRFMFCSGNITPDVEDFLSRHDLMCLEKPFTMSKLQKMVQDIMDKNS